MLFVPLVAFSLSGNVSESWFHFNVYFYIEIVMDDFVRIYGARWIFMLLLSSFCRFFALTLSSHIYFALS